MLPRLGHLSRKLVRDVTRNTRFSIARVSRGILALGQRFCETAGDSPREERLVKRFLNFLPAAVGKEVGHIFGQLFHLRKGRCIDGIGKPVK